MQDRIRQPKTSSLSNLSVHLDGVAQTGSPRRGRPDGRLSPTDSRQEAKQNENYKPVKKNLQSNQKYHNRKNHFLYTNDNDLRLGCVLHIILQHHHKRFGVFRTLRLCY